MLSCVQVVCLSQHPPFPLPIMEPLFPQQHSNKMIHRIEEQPPLSDPHPQFVAAKSLMFQPPVFIYTSYYVGGKSVFPKTLTKKPE